MIHFKFNKYMTQCGIRFKDSTYLIVMTNHREKVTCKNCKRCGSGV